MKGNFSIEIKRDERVANKLAGYPEAARNHLLNLRRLILETAAESEVVQQLEETLKWGEPSYLNKYGSTIRMDWKAKNPKQYALYFSCSTSLVETFKDVYGDRFRYEGKRALVFLIGEELPEREVKDCLRLALEYKRLKHLPFLGR